MKTISRIFAPILLGVVLGAPLGIYLVQYKYIDKEKAVGMEFEEGVVDDFAKKEFIHADPQSSRQALQYAIKIHKEMQGTSTLSGRAEKWDLGWCYAELSLIEESAGNTELAGEYMNQAEQILTGLGLKDSSGAHIREMLQRKAATTQQLSKESK
jgi:hypothetical protein